MNGAVQSVQRGIGLRDRWLGLRDRLLANPRFHRLAARTPFTRSLARKRARSLFDLCAGFVYSQVLLACVRLDLFEILADGPVGFDALRLRLGLDEDATRRLLDAAVSLDLASRRSGGTYGLGELGAAIRGAPGVAEMVEHHALVYRDLADPVGLLRGEVAETALSRYWAYTDRGAAAEVGSELSAPYTALMAASQPFVSEEVLDAYPVRRHRRLLDVGGGNGTFLRAAAERAPNLELVLFDLPTVAEQARIAFAGAGLSGRAETVGGSFFDDPLPRDADLISLIRVLYDHDDAHVLRILRAVRAAIPEDGTLLLAEPMAGTPGAAPIGDAYFGFYLLAMQGGRPRTPDEFSALLGEAGFAEPRLLRTNRPLLARAMIARPA